MPPTKRQIQSAYGAYKRARTTYKKYSPMVRRTVKRGRRVYRRTMSKRRMNPMRAINAGGNGAQRLFAFENFKDSTTQQLSTRLMYGFNLTALSKQTSADEINFRNGDLVNLRGCKLWMMITNQIAAPVCYNIAVVIPKRELNTNPPGTSDFFRGAGTTRSLDFDNARTGCQFANLPINKDLHDVVSHKRYIIEPGRPQALTTTEYKSNRPSYKMIKTYIKIKQQVAYDGANQEAIGRNVWLIMWCDTWSNNTASVPANGVTRQMQLHTYFKE